MRKRLGYFAAVMLLHVSCSLFGQEKPLEFSAYTTWPRLAPLGISNDGKYAAYVISTPVGGSTLTLQALDQKWQRDLVQVSSGQFTEDSKRFIFQNMHDSMGICDLEQGHVVYYPEVAEYKMPSKGDGRWLLYRKKQVPNELILLDLLSGQDKVFQNILDFGVNEDGQEIWMTCLNGGKGNAVGSMVWLNLATSRIDTLSKGFLYSNETFNKIRVDLAFVAQDSAGESLRYFKPGMDSATKVCEIVSQETAFSKGRPILFNQQANKVFFCIQKSRAPGADLHFLRGNNPAFLQNYQDERLDFEDHLEYGSQWAYADIAGNLQVMKILGRPNNGGVPIPVNYDTHDYLVYDRTVWDEADGPVLTHTYLADLCLVDVQGGSTVLLEHKILLSNLALSVTGRFIIWFDEDKGQWHTYDLKKKIRACITSKIQTLFAELRPGTGSVFSGAYGLVGWLDNDQSVILEDKYDLWEIDPKGEKPPVNLTNGYGQKHSIQLRKVEFVGNDPHSIHTGDTIMLAAFNLNTKDDGFCSLKIGHDGQLDPPAMEPRMSYYEFDGGDILGTQYSYHPVKAKAASRYLVERMSATEYPNLYVSDDLRAFEPVTDLQPQKKFNWFTTELYHWKLPDGKQGEGILYRPQNFNPQKKYPVIFYYYEKNANSVHHFIHPNGATES